MLALLGAHPILHISRIRANRALHSIVRRRIVACCWDISHSAQAWNVLLVIWRCSLRLAVVNLPEFVCVTLYTFFACVLKFCCHRISIKGTSWPASWLAVERFSKMQTWNTVDIPYVCCKFCCSRTIITGTSHLHVKGCSW